MSQTGDCTRKCEEVGEIAVMEAGKLLKARAMEVSSLGGSLKRRKLAADDDDDDRLVVVSRRRDDVNSPEKSPSPAASEASSDHPSVSRCSSNEFAKVGSRSVDPKVEESHAEASFVTEISKLIKCRFSRETTPTSELLAETDEMESSTAKKPSAASLRRKNPEPKRMPPPAEIEEFFAAAEKQEQKRFANKYNYDVAKDVPLEGRYQWVRLKP